MKRKPCFTIIADTQKKYINKTIKQIKDLVEEYKEKKKINWLIWGEWQFDASLTQFLKQYWMDLTIFHISKNSSSKLKENLICIEKLALVNNILVEWSSLSKYELPSSNPKSRYHCKNSWGILSKRDAGNVILNT